MTEILVVIGIIVILASVLLPVLVIAQRKGNTFRVASDLNGIAVALQAYHDQFGDYPRVDPAFPGTGAQVLAKALLGPGSAGDNLYSSSATYFPGDMVTVAGTPPTYFMAQVRTTGSTPTNGGNWIQLPFTYADGADGPGFRVRATGQGAVYGPFLNTDKFKVGKQMAILDYYGNPVLYFPGKAGAVPSLAPTLTNGATSNITLQPSPVAVTTATTTEKLGYVSIGGAGLYDVQSNMWVFSQKPSLFSYYGSQLSTLPQTWAYTAPGTTGATRWPLDTTKIVARVAAKPTVIPFATDYDLKNYIQYRLEQAGSPTPPFLLWSAGANGTYFDDDDVANFGTH
jgi:type II secretory pathway pseudopilin PulG